SPTSTCGPTNSTLGGFAGRIAVDTVNNDLYVAVAESFSVGKLRVFDLGTQAIVTAPLSAASEQIVDVAVCPGGDIVGTDQTFNAGGLRVWRGATERTSSAMSIGVPPTVNALVCY